MNDLISRKTLLEAMKHKCEGNCKNCMHSTFLSDDEHCGLIDAQPTAYDVDKVVKQITEAQKDPNLYVYAWDAYQKAIEIVKGGVE